MIESQLAPVQLAVSQIAPEPEKPQISLLGTIAWGAGGIGVFLDQPTKAVLRLRAGEGHEGWVLFSVQRREVTLIKGNLTANLLLPAPAPDLRKSELASSMPPSAASAPRVLLPGSTIARAR